MDDYEGMRWFKCDFQVQTPEDAAHWADTATRLPEPRRPMVAPPPDENGIVGTAEVEVEVVTLTDWRKRLSSKAKILAKRRDERKNISIFF